MRSATIISLAGLALALSCLPAAGGPRAFVASTGNDGNVAVSCSPAAPCRSFQAAHDVVDAGGEVIALDTAGYGRLIISKSITIMSSPGVIASVTTSANFHAIGITASGGRVVLRGLNILNTGVANVDGVSLIAADSLSIENCVLSGFLVGVNAGAPTRVKVVDTIIRSSANGVVVTQGGTAEIVRSHVEGRGGMGEGFTVVQSNDGSTSSVSISDSTASYFLHGFAARSEGGGGGPVRFSCTRCTSTGNSQNGFHSYASTGSVSMMVSSSMASSNGQYGFFQQSAGGGTATFQSLGDNTLHSNALGATSGTITVVTGN